jgi:leader peptidase (prepilin peptidase)/N-methyltransferase
MTSLGYAGSTVPLFVTGLGLLGLLVSPVVEMLIAKLLPRIGQLPSTRVRMTTALITGLLCAGFAFRFGADPGLLLSGLIFLLAAAIGGQQWTSLLRALAGAAILFVIYLILAIIAPNGMGMGDVKFAAPIGLYLGYLGWSQLLYGGLLGFILNGIVTLLAIRRVPSERASEVPHGPSMLFATAGVALFLA